ncbi:MAG: Gfo/Idh/MocA family oxidoreductase [Planctomycetota bacterium]|nr:Gfo/Idh/MocA family oxidoreductase [Planctomycetota bacterium]
MKKFKVGIIGAGNISGAYLGGAKKWPILEVVAVSDMLLERAQARAKEFNVPKACTVDELLKDESIDIVINLTIPKAHAEVAIRAIEAGKSVITEKPLAVDREEGLKVIAAAAKKKGVRVGCAPDTFFGAGHQTARKLIDDGAIGRPVAATAFMMGRGHEGWHPDPEFYYKPGGGPMFDMGPYYVTDLMQILGRVKRVSGATSIAIPERTIGSAPKKGQKIVVETPDHLAGNLEFESGCIATLIMSFAVYAPEHHGYPITIFGTEGSLQVPDPNGFDGGVRLFKPGQKGYEDVPLTHTKGYGRSVGVADLAYGLASGRDHRASGERAMHVLDAMQGFIDASRTGVSHVMKTPYTRPAMLPVGLPEGELDM